jgi:chromosome segregation ATPase
VEADLEQDHEPQPAEPAQAAVAADPAVAHELEDLRAELEQVRAELRSEHHRREVLEQELRNRDSVEDDLRNAMAMQEAQLASAVAEASQRVRQEERLRDLPPVPGTNGERHGSEPADEAFLTRLERARRASETAPSA